MSSTAPASSPGGTPIPTAKPTLGARLAASIPLLIAAWVVSRTALVLIVSDHTPYPEGGIVINDVKLYAEWSNLLVTGRFPIGDDMWQYPPGAGGVFALAALIGSNPVTGFLVLALMADLATLIVLVVAAHRRRLSLAAPWAWVIAALLIGPVFIARFDLFPTLCAVVTLVLVARPVWSGAAAAVGTLLKVWPGLMLIALPRRSLPRGILGFVVTGGAVLVGISLWASGGISFLGEQRARGLQVESVAAWPFLVANSLGFSVDTEFRYGSMELNLPITIPIGTAVTLGGFAVIGILGVLRLLGRLERVSPADIALATLLVSLVTSRVLSPQYSVWIAGVAAVTFLDPRSRMRRVVGLLVPSILVTQVIYPWAYGDLIGGVRWVVLLQSVRILLLVAATVLALVEVGRVTSWRRSSPAAAAASDA